MDDSKDNDKDKDKGGLLITFPNNKSVNATELGSGSEYIVGSGDEAVPTPDIVDIDDLKEEERKRDDFVRNQALVKAIENDIDVRETISVVLREIAEELAHLKFERKKASAAGKNTANYTISRIASLRQLADVLLKRQENLRAEQLDLQSPRFKKVLLMWMEFVYESMQKAGYQDQEIDMVFTVMKADMVDWEKKIIDVS